MVIYGHLWSFMVIYGHFTEKKLEKTTFYGISVEIIFLGFQEKYFTTFYGKKVGKKGQNRLFSEKSWYH